MLNVYISIFYRDSEREQIEVKERIKEKVEKYFSTKEITFLDSIISKDDKKYLWEVSEGLKNQDMQLFSIRVDIMSKADIIVMEKDWEGKLDCEMDFMTAKSYDTLVLFETKGSIRDNT